MLPTLKPGQNLISFNWFVKPKNKDIVIIKMEGKMMVKRINKINSHSFFIQGDNKKGSTDSRSFGWIKRDQIIGKVIFVYNNSHS